MNHKEAACPHDLPIYRLVPYKWEIIHMLTSFMDVKEISQMEIAHMENKDTEVNNFQQEW